jgi:hypothetical protein
VALAGQPIALEAGSRVAGSTPAVVATVATDARGRLSYRAPAGPSRRLRLSYTGIPGRLVPLTRTAQLRVRASSTIHASPRTIRGSGRVGCGSGARTCSRTTWGTRARSSFVCDETHLRAGPGIATLLPMIVLWTAVNFLPAIILAVDAHQHGEPSWTVLLVVFGGFLAPVYFWTRR